MEQQSIYWQPLSHRASAEYNPKPLIGYKPEDKKKESNYIQMPDFIAPLLIDKTATLTYTLTQAFENPMSLHA